MALLSIAGIAISIIGLIYLAYRTSKNRRGAVKVRRRHTDAANEMVRVLQTKIDSLTSELQQTLEDPVTKLPGWKRFEDHLTQQVNESARYHFTLGVVYVDINDFKVVNNAMNHEIGNQLLHQVAERLQQCIRQVDSIGRLEKDIFVLSLTQLAKPETAAVVTQRVLQVLGESFKIENHELSVTVSMGIAVYPSDGSDAATLLRNAAHALSLAKKKGKHGYHFYQQKMHADSQRELALYTGLGRETIFNELCLLYQPVMNVQEEAVACMDVLLHWDCKELGLIAPEELSLLMERQRKANLMTEWLLQSACKQFLHWRTLGFNPPLLGVPVTIHQIENSRFIYRLSQILQENAFKPEWLLLEIKDSQDQTSFDVLEKAFNMLSYLGVNIAIDHFGMSSYSLRYLKNFPVRYIKLDPAVVVDIEHNQRTVALIESLLHLAKHMSAQLIVPGVESDQQLVILRKAGCTLLQGQALGGKLTDREVAATLPS